MAVLKATEDEVDVINISLGGTISKNNMLQEAINEADKNNIRVVAGAGNDGKEIYDGHIIYPVCYDNVIGVGAAYIDSNKIICKETYSNYGKPIEIYALGRVTSTNINGGYSTDRGTSFATPYISGLCAILKSLYPKDNNENTKLRINQGTNRITKYSFGTVAFVDFYGTVTKSDIVVDYTLTPTITVENSKGSYYNKTITINCDDEGAKIYYAMKKHFPSSSANTMQYDDGSYTINRYTGSFTIDYDCTLVATAISNNKLESSRAVKFIRLGHGNNGFYCDDDGVIQTFIPNEYNGDLKNIVVPDSFDGVTPVSFVERDTDFPFFENNIVSITMPESINTISSNCFSFCEALEKVIAPGVKYINDYGFMNDENLRTLQLGNVEYVGNSAFSYCYNIDISEIIKTVTETGEGAFSGCKATDIFAPKLETAGAYAFSSMKDLTKIDMPSLVEAGYDSFSFNENLEYVNLPIIKNLPKRLFYECPNLKTVYLPQVTSYENNEKLTRLEFDNLENLTLNYKYQPEIISVPNSCASISGIYKKITTVYGTEAEDNYI